MDNSCQGWVISLAVWRLPVCDFHEVRFWPLADIPLNVAVDVAFGGKADMTYCTAYVRF